MSTAMKAAPDGVTDEFRQKYRNKAALLKRQNEQYNEFCRENGMKRLDDRLKIAEWNRSEAARASAAAREAERAVEALKNPPSGGIIETEKFKPASTIDEAEKQAKQFASSVDLSGAKNMDAVNSVNQTLTELSSAYPIKTLKSITANGRLKRSNARSNGIKLELNTDYLNDPGPPSDWKERIANYPEYIHKLQESIDSNAYPSSSRKTIKRRIDQLKEEMKFERWSVSSAADDRISSTVKHEYGHILADQYFGQINGRMLCENYEGTVKIRELVNKTFARARTSGDIFRISMYANTNSHEFFAECFAAHCNGEELPEYITKMLTEALGK